MNHNLVGHLGRPDVRTPSFFREIHAPRPAASTTSAPATETFFHLYPRDCDAEVLGALRFLMEVEGVPAARIESQSRLDSGTVDAILSGEYQPSADVVGRLCRTMGMSRWLFYLVGSIKYGADLGFPELQWLVEKRKRALAENADEPMVELVAEATRIFFQLGSTAP